MWNIIKNKIITYFKKHFKILKKAFIDLALGKSKGEDYRYNLSLIFAFAFDLGLLIVFSKYLFDKGIGNLFNSNITLILIVMLAIVAIVIFFITRK